MLTVLEPPSLKGPATGPAFLARAQEQSQINQKEYGICPGSFLRSALSSQPPSLRWRWLPWRSRITRPSARALARGTTDAAYANNLVIAGDVPAGLVPGKTLDLVNESVKNPAANPGDARVTTVHATDIDVGLADESDACNDSWFSIADVPVNDNLAPNETVTFAAQIVMSNPLDVDQNACKNQPISIEWDSGL